MEERETYTGPDIVAVERMVEDGSRTGRRWKDVWVWSNRSSLCLMHRKRREATNVEEEKQESDTHREYERYMFDER